MSKENFNTSKKERMGYNAYFVGQNMIYFLVLTYLSIYFTNTLGISTVAVGTIFLVARIWDAVNDPMLSVLVEKSNLKSGRFKPWVKSVAIVLPLVTILLFSFTDALINASMGVRIAYASIVYILWGMVYTISDAPAFALSTIMTDNQDERTVIISNAKLFSLVGILGLLIVANPIMGLTNGSWFYTASIVSLIAFVFMNGINFAQERVEPKTETPSTKDIINAIIKNKYLMTYVIVFVVVLGTNFSNVLNAYVAIDLFKDESLIAILGMLSMIPMLVFVPFLPKILKKINKIDLTKYSFVGMIVLAIVSYFVGYDNMPIFIVLTMLKGVCLLPVTMVCALFFVDCIEYGENQTGERFEAAVFSAQTFSNKAVSAFTGAFSLWLIGLAGYVSSTANETVVQSEQALSGLWAVYTLTPIIGGVIGLFVMTKYYDLTDEKVEVMIKENKQRREAKMLNIKKEA